NSGKQSNSINKEIQLQPVPPAQINSLKILVVDDDPDSQYLLKTGLKPLGKEILLASTGIEAQETFNANPDIDLILMDLRIPGIDGLELTRQIRQTNNKVIILAQTAYAMAGDKARAIEAGCNDYISKPIIKDELIRLILKYFSV
ncbi:MAG: response regulator, partial [Bacteroidota bacterium]